MPNPARTIPLFWRWIGVVFACLLFLTGGVVIIGHAQPADPNRCLIFSDSLQNSAAVDLYTGATIGFARHYPQTLMQSVYQSQPSPDGLHLAFSRYDEPSARVQLYVKATDRIGVQNSILVQAMVGALDFAPYTPPRDFAWSPDGQWLAYWWQMPNGEAFLGIADPQGHVISTQSIWPISPSAVQSNVFFHGWSADSRYLALSVRDAASGQYTLSLWAAPTLTHVRDAPYTRLKDEAITPLNDPDQLAQWSTRGHQIAYLAATSDFRQLQLGVVSLEGDPVLTPLPVVPKVLLSNGELPTFNWSPDDRHLALIRISPVRHWLEVIDPVAQTVQVVTDQAMAMETLEAQIYTHWSADSQTLFYAQMAASTANPGNLDIMALHLADQRRETLIADVYDSAIATSDRTYLLYKQSIWKNNIESIDAVSLDLATGGMVHIPGLAAEFATYPLLLLGESNNGWLAIGDQNVDDLSTDLFILVFDSTTGEYRRMPGVIFSFNGSGVLNNFPLQFLTGDGGLFAAINENDQVIMTRIADLSQRFMAVYPRPFNFRALLWSPDNQQVSILFSVQHLPRDGVDSLSVLDAASGQTKNIEPLPIHYSYLNYAPCR